MEWAFLGCMDRERKKRETVLTVHRRRQHCGKRKAGILCATRIPAFLIFRYRCMKKAFGFATEGFLIWVLRLFQSFQLSKPQRAFGVTWHAPISAGRKADGANLWSIGQARALELLLEETAVEVFEPFQ